MRVVSNVQLLSSCTRRRFRFLALTGWRKKERETVSAETRKERERHREREERAKSERPRNQRRILRARSPTSNNFSCPAEFPAIGSCSGLLRVANLYKFIFFFKFGALVQCVKFFFFSGSIVYRTPNFLACRGSNWNNPKLVPSAKIPRKFTSVHKQANCLNQRKTPKVKLNKN